MKKYKYAPLDYKADRERSCYTPGRVYVYNESPSGKRGFKTGDYLLCIRKSGDCHYDFIRIVKTTETAYNMMEVPNYPLWAYFSLEQKTSAYGGMKEAFPDMETLSPTDLVHTLYHEQVLIPLQDTFDNEKKEQFKRMQELQNELQQVRIKFYS